MATSVATIICARPKYSTAGFHSFHKPCLNTRDHVTQSFRQVFKSSFAVTGITDAQLDSIVGITACTDPSLTFSVC